MPPQARLSIPETIPVLLNLIVRLVCDAVVSRRDTIVREERRDHVHKVGLELQLVGPVLSGAVRETLLKSQRICEFAALA